METFFFWLFGKKWVLWNMRQGCLAAMYNAKFEEAFLASRAQDIQAGIDSMRAKLEAGEVPSAEMKGYQDEISSEENLKKLKFADVERKQNEYASISRKYAFLKNYKG